MNRFNHRRRFTAYPKYVDSEVEWIGKVPSHWATSRLKATTSGCYNGVWGDPPSGDSTDSVCIRVADFNRISFDVNLSDLTVRSIPDQELGVRELQSGDLLLEKSGGGEKQPVGAVVTFYGLEQPAVCSNFIARMPITAPNSARFITYVHAAFYSMRVNVRSIKQSTGIQNLDSDSYLSEKICLPPPGEQVTIANFLDRETAKIDALIAKKERLIELLKEKRTALITHAVTKGLDPNVPMQKSRAKWLDSYPGDWRGMPLKRWVKIPITDGPHETPPFVLNGVPFISAEAIKNDRIDFDKKWGDISEQLHRQYSRKCNPVIGDILLCKSGATTGKAAMVETETEFSVWSPLVLIRADREEIFPEYLFLSLRADYVQEQIRRTWSAGTQPNIAMRKLKQLFIVAPSVGVQSSILGEMQETITQIDSAISKVQEAITRLREYRTALISAAVTGKIDVREEVA